jgi:hypothetical protein
MKPYLDQTLTYTNDGRLLDENGWSVMMEWERPLMEAGGRVISERGGDILNVGFGLGIVDSHIQTFNPKSHTIIECHKDVLSYMKRNGWYERVNVIEGRWQDVWEDLPKFDGIYWDTWEETPFKFYSMLGTLLKEDGVFSFFNNPTKSDLEKGLKMRESEWKSLSQIMDIYFEEIQIPMVGKNQGREYFDTKQKIYWNPICKLKNRWNR